MSTYSFQDVNATLVGAGAVLDLGAGSGVADEGITIEMAGDKNSMTIGADGEGMHSLHADKSGTITVTLLKTSPTNAKLMALYQLQTLATSLHGQNVITVTNPKTGDVTTGRQCAFKKIPANVYAKDGGTNAWVFDVIKIDEILGIYQ
jgi:hypothetical protein